MISKFGVLIIVLVLIAGNPNLGELSVQASTTDGGEGEDGTGNAEGGGNGEEEVGTPEDSEGGGSTGEEEVGTPEDSDAGDEGEGMLDKDATSHDDLFDSFRLSLLFWH